MQIISAIVKIYIHNVISAMSLACVGVPSYNLGAYKWHIGLLILLYIGILQVRGVITNDNNIQGSLVVMHFVRLLRF